MRALFKSKFLKYLTIGYVFALIVESLSAASGDSQIFRSPTWLIFFLIWYGILLTISYKLFRDRPIWVAIVAWAILGPILEGVLFRGQVIVTDMLYSLIFVPPLWLAKRFS